MPKKRLTIEFIKEVIESEDGYKLLSTEYKNRVKLKILCKNNHEFEMRFDGFQYGYRCRECYFDRKRLSLEQIKKIIEDSGYKLLSTEYKTNQDSLELKCPENHIFNITYSCFQQGRSCNVCWREKNKQYGLDKRLSYDFVKDFIEKNDGYKLISNEYITCDKKLIIKCDNDHIYEASWSNFKAGRRCQDCAYIKNWKNCTQNKEYTLPSGKIVIYQGYEHYVLDILLKLYDETEIDIHPDLIIDYIFEEKYRKHYPDIFVPKENLVIEVKSKFTYSVCVEKNKQKQIAAKNLGYRYEFWIILDNGDLFEIIN